MKSTLIIGMIVVAMGFMVSILVGKYNTIIEEDKNKKAIEQKRS